MQWLPPAPWVGRGQAQSPHPRRHLPPAPAPASSHHPPQPFALGGSNNGVHLHSLSGHPFPPWHQSHFSFVSPCQASLSPPNNPPRPEQYDRQMQDHFSPSHGGLLGRKDPLFHLPYAPWPGSAVGQGRACLIVPTSPILSTRYCSLLLPPSLPSVYPTGEYTLPHPHDTVQGSFL